MKIKKDNISKVSVVRGDTGLQGIIEAIKQLIQIHEYDDALRKINILVNDYPNEPEIWMMRAAIRSIQGGKEDAINNYSKAVRIIIDEPHPYYMRGIVYFQLERYWEAASDFTKVIELCDYHKSDYYREGAYFFRADTYIRLKEYDKAKADCDHISDGMVTWTDQLKSKSDLLAACQNSRSMNKNKL